MLPAPCGAVPGQVVPADYAGQKSKQLVGVGRSPERIRICHHREMIGGFHRGAEAAVRAPRERSSFKTSGTGKASTVPRLDDMVVAMNREL